MTDSSNIQTNPAMWPASTDMDWIPGTGETWTKYRDGGEYLYVKQVYYSRESGRKVYTGQSGWLDRSDIVRSYDYMQERGNV